MIEVEHIHKIVFQNRYVRFSRKTTLSIPPAPGMSIDYVFGRFILDDVILNNGGGIIVESFERDTNGEKETVSDSSYKDYLDACVEEEGWVVLSDVVKKF